MLGHTTPHSKQCRSLHRTDISSGFARNRCAHTVPIRTCAMGDISAAVASTQISEPAKASTSINVLAFADPDAPELAVVRDGLPKGAKLLAVGGTLDALSEQLTSDEAWASVDAMLCTGNKVKCLYSDIPAFFNRLTRLKWVHSSSAGIEHLLTIPCIAKAAKSSIILTNAKGVYSNSLAEWALFACNYFAKDLPRLRKAQAAQLWEPYDVEELRGKTMGIVGYGDIGRACARLARAYQMKVVALRRRTELSEEEKKEGYVDQLYPPSDLPGLMSVSDYVVMATPHTPATDKMLTSEAIAAMKPTGVFINIGRGKCVDEAALVAALSASKIRGAALDVFAVEPLPQDSPLWSMQHVLISPHSADRTKEFQFESLAFFVDNLKRYVEGQSLLNVCNIEAGY